jgi:chemotaxis protein MotB
MDDDSPGVPEWVVTYGDMMSLLLTFFIMLVSLSEVVAENKYRAILDALQKYTGSLLSG